MTTLPGGEFLVDNIPYLATLATQPHDEAVVLSDPVTGNLIGLPPGVARALIADLQQRVDLIDPQAVGT